MSAPSLIPFPFLQLQIYKQTSKTSRETGKRGRMRAFSLLFSNLSCAHLELGYKKEGIWFIGVPSS